MERTDNTGSPTGLRALGLGVAVVGFALWGALACSSTPTPTRADLMKQTLVRLEEAVRDEVTDPERAEAILALLHEFHDEELEFLELVRVKKEWLTKLNRRHDAERAAFELEVRELRDAREAFRDEVLEFYLGLRELLSGEEFLNLMGHLRAEEARWEELER